MRVEDVGAGDEHPVDVIRGQGCAEVRVLGKADGFEEEGEGRFVDVERLGQRGAVDDEGHPAGGAEREALEEGGREGRLAVDAAAVGVDGLVGGEVLLADWRAGAVGADEEAALVRGAVFECGCHTVVGDGILDELFPVRDVFVQSCQEDFPQHRSVAGVYRDTAADSFSRSACRDRGIDSVEVGLAGFTLGAGVFEMLP